MKRLCLRNSQGLASLLALLLVMAACCPPKVVVQPPPAPVPVGRPFLPATNWQPGMTPEAERRLFQESLLLSVAYAKALEAQLKVYEDWFKKYVEARRR